MSPRSRAARVSSVLAVAALFTATRSLGADSRPNLNQPVSGYDAGAVERARSGAVWRLQKPGCLKVLTDYRDREGRTLAENLATWGMSAAEYMRMLPFRHGASVPLCKRDLVALATTPGIPPVYVCPAAGGRLRSRFADVDAENASVAEAMVIHEMLHTLGLGENPPTQAEITARIRARCR